MIGRIINVKLVPCWLHVASLFIGISCFLEYLYAAALVSAAMTSFLRRHTCWSTVPKNSRTAASEFVAHLWWRLHTQHLSLDRPDLVTSCLFFAVINATRCRLKTVLKCTEIASLPTTTDATDSKLLKRYSAEGSRDASVALFVLLPNLTSKIAACPFLLQISDSHKSRIYPDKCKFWRKLTDYCFCSNDIRLSYDHEATLLRLFVVVSPEFCEK